MRRQRGPRSHNADIVEALLPTGGVGWVAPTQYWLSGQYWDNIAHSVPMSWVLDQNHFLSILDTNLVGIDYFVVVKLSARIIASYSANRYSYSLGRSGKIPINRNFLKCICMLTIQDVCDIPEQPITIGTEPPFQYIQYKKLKILFQEKCVKIWRILWFSTIVIVCLGFMALKGLVDHWTRLARYTLPCHWAYQCQTLQCF